MKKDTYISREEAFDSFYFQTGYSEFDFYNEQPDDLMEFEGESEYIKKFNLKKSDVLNIIKVITVSAAYHRSSQKSMMATRSSTMIPPEDVETLKKVFQDSEALIQTRQNHMREVAEVAEMISDGLGLNSNFTYLIGLLHDIGHTWNGHSGERMLSSIARLNNCGYIVHNAMGAYILERENIIDTAIEGIKQFNKKIKEEDVRDFMRYVIDGMVSHNGEGVVGKIVPKDKSTVDMAEEIKKCFTELGYDKKIMPATMEGAIIRYADIIAYTRSDILDGFRLKDVNGNKIIKEFDNDYLSIIGTIIARENNYNRMLTLENKFLIELYGLGKRIKALQGQIETQRAKPEVRLELERSMKEREIIQKKYNEFCQYKIQYAKEYISKIQPKSEVKTRVTQMIQNAFIKDLIEASKGKNYITMSPLIRRTFFALRDLNVRKIVPFTRRSFELEQLPVATKNLVDVFSNVLIKSGVAYKAIPEEERNKFNIRIDEEETIKEKDRVIKGGSQLDFDRKMIHYYNRLDSKKINEIYQNAIEATRDITRYDIQVALGKKKYEGELKEIYEMLKIMPIRNKIGMMGKTSETMTSEDEERLLDIIMAERLKDIERIVASKMAIEYIGGMTDNTIISVLLSKNILSSKQIIEGYGRPTAESRKEDVELSNLQKSFAEYEKMILPDDIDEADITL